MVASFYQEATPIPDAVYQRYPASLTMSLLIPYKDDLCLARRTLLSALAPLKSQGCPGVHVEVPCNDQITLAFYAKLGFFDIPLEAASANGVCYMGRLI